jgi:hypothetical protein
VEQPTTALAIQEFYGSWGVNILPQYKLFLAEMKVEMSTGNLKSDEIRSFEK